MAEWHVSGSESEGEGVGDGGVELGGLRIPPHRVAELLKTIESRKTLDLECLASAAAGGSDGRRERRRKHNRHKRKSEVSGTAGSSISQEEVSETASELRSTASTEAREEKWHNVSHFDYFHEDSTGSDLTLHKRQRKLPPGGREKKLASLDQIVADVKQQKERQQADLSTTPEITLPYPHHHRLLHQPTTHGLPAECGVGHSPRPSSSYSAALFDFDEGSDPDSPTGGDNMKMSVLSQINRVEKLLDDEGLT